MIKSILYKLIQCESEIDQYKCEVIYDLYVIRMANMLTHAGAYGEHFDTINDTLTKYNILNYLSVVYFSYLCNINKISKKEMIRILDIMCERGNVDKIIVSSLIQEITDSATTENLDIVCSALKFEDVYYVYVEDGIIPFVITEFSKWVIDNDYNIFIGILSIIDTIRLKQRNT